MKLSDFDFDLPEDLIATRPAVPRSTSKLLVARAGQPLVDHVFTDLPNMLAEGDLLVMNDTKVIPARLFGERTRQGAEGATRAKIEVTLLGPEPDGQAWNAMLKPLRKVKDGETIAFGADLNARLVSRHDGIAKLAFNLSGADLDHAIEAVGQMPLPPYIAAKRAADLRDKTDYQTIWAKTNGAVAAPTASLHFDQPVLDALRKKGVKTTFVTLHVGAGTFLPVKTDDISNHKMHSEWGEVTAAAADAINDTLNQGRKVIAVGTTALRLIETAATAKGTIAPWVGDTDIFISPGHEFKVTRGLITNFHLPKSTLLMLVSALIGHDRMFEIYEHAIENRYRFFSYGDSSLLLP